MENKENYLYINSYLSHLNKQRKFPEQNPVFVSETNDIQELKNKISTFDGIDFNNKTIDVKKLQNLSFDELSKLLSLVLQLFNKTEDKFLLLIADKLKNLLENSGEINKSEEKQLSMSKQTEIKNEQNKIIESKAKRYGDFSFERAKNPAFKATTRPTIDTRNLLSSLNKEKSQKENPTEISTRDQLVQMFEPSTFYRLNQRQKEILFQAVVNDYLQSQGVEPCAVKMSKLHMGNHTVAFGEYVPTEGVIKLNSKLFNNIDEMSNVNNPHFPYRILSTLIHEAQHRVQFMNIDNPPKNLAEKAMKESLFLSQSGKNFSDYLAEADELDARNASLKYFREQANNSNNPATAKALANFYNFAKQEEINNGKSPVSQTLMNEYQDIYDEKFLGNGINLNASQYSKEMFDVLLGREHQEFFEKRKTF